MGRATLRTPTDLIPKLMPSAQFITRLTRGKPTLCLPSYPAAATTRETATSVRGASSTTVPFIFQRNNNARVSFRPQTLTVVSGSARSSHQTVNLFGLFSRKKKMAAPVTVQEVEAARDAWIAAVKKGSVDETVGCYDPDAGKLLGTVDLDGVRTGKDKIREYFVGFLETNYDTVVPNFPATIAEDDIQQLGDGTVAYSGYYTFDLGKGSTNKVANAKFTYIYRRGADGKLKILLHNSGFTPAGAVEK